MSTRYYNAGYMTRGPMSPYGSPYRSPRSGGMSYYYDNKAPPSPPSRSNRNGRISSRPRSPVASPRSRRASKPSQQTSKGSSSTSKRGSSMWKAKKTDSSSKAESTKKIKKKTKHGEFSQEAIEAELNKYKKGVFYHDATNASSNGHSQDSSSSQNNTTNATSNQYQLTRTQRRSPAKHYNAAAAVAAASPQASPSRTSPSRSKPKRRSRNKTSSSSPSRRPTTSSSASTMIPGGHYYDPYSANNVHLPIRPRSASSTMAGTRMLYDAYNGTAGSALSPYRGYPMATMPQSFAGQTASGPRGVVQDDGSWYPYPDILQHLPPQPIAPAAAYRTPKRKGTASVDVSTPIRTSGGVPSDEYTKMTPGRRVNKIQKQLEYYFSPQNMGHDAYLCGKMDAHGWVEIETVMEFNRMQVLGATKSLVVEAAYHSLSIEIEREAKGKKEKRIRMANLWKEYVGKEVDAKEDEVDIESIVAKIERDAKRKKKREERKKKEKKDKEEKDDKDKDGKSVEDDGDMVEID